MRVKTSSKRTSPSKRTPFPVARLEHRFPGSDGVVPEHSAHHRLSASTKRPGLHNNPLRMCGWHVIPEAAHLALLSVHQPPDTIPRWMAVNQWPVLAWHDDTMAKQPLLLLMGLRGSAPPSPYENEFAHLHGHDLVDAVSDLFQRLLN